MPPDNNSSTKTTTVVDSLKAGTDTAQVKNDPKPELPLPKTYSNKLVAVEYAIPLDLSVNAPTGFTGNLDVWKRDTFFQLWLLHAWVWEYNPLGVFNPTNPLVHSH